ncbi:MAG TPA: MaoC/PaaZ C-terminal domain-containing protein [Bacteroidales bacterium]
MFPFKPKDSFSKKFTVNEAIYHGFIDLFQDKNPLHTNDKFAQEKGFAGKVMHGNILNGFLSFFIGECLPVKNVIIHSQEISFKNAVYLEDELTFFAEVNDVFESVRAVEFKFSFKNSDNKVVAKGKIQIGLI